MSLDSDSGLEHFPTLPKDLLDGVGTFWFNIVPNTGLLDQCPFLRQVHKHD